MKSDGQVFDAEVPISVSNAEYVGIWTILLLFESASAAFLAGAAYIYLRFTDEDSLLWYVAYNYLFTEPILFLMKYYKTVGIGYAVVSLPFIYGATQMIAHSMWQRRLTFGPARPQPDTNTKTCLHETFHAWKERCHSCFSSRGVTSLRIFTVFHTKYAVQIMLVVKTLQLALQTIQGYRFSKYNSSLALNQVYGVMIFFNAVSSPVIHFCFSRFAGGHPRKRLYFMLADTALDFTWGIVIQLAMFAPYWRSYVNRGNLEQATIELAWETNDRQLRQVLVVSTVNFVLSAFPFITSAFMYDGVRIMLNDGAILGMNSSKTQASVLQGVVPMTSTNYIPNETHKKHNHPDAASSKLKILTNAYMLLMALYGTLILLISITASGVFFPIDTSGVGCTDRLHPWFWRPLTCVGRSINCDYLGISGRTDDLKHVLQELDPFLVGRLELCNCDNLEMPANIRQYNDLVTLMVKNSSIVNWGVDAALTDQSTPGLQTIMLVDVHVVGIPDGFTKHGLPSALEFISFTRVNVNDFIGMLSDDVWSGIWLVKFDDCQLTRIPSVVATMSNLMAATIRNNPIISVEAEDFNAKDSFLTQINLEDTSLTMLSNTTWELFAKQLKTLNIQSTNISSISEHIHEVVNPLLSVRAYDTPLCAATNASSVQRWPWVECDYVFDW